MYLLMLSIASVTTFCIFLTYIKNNNQNASVKMCISKVTFVVDGSVIKVLTWTKVVPLAMEGGHYTRIVLYNVKQYWVITVLICKHYKLNNFNRFLYILFIFVISDFLNASQHSWSGELGCQFSFESCHLRCTVSILVNHREQNTFLVVYLPTPTMSTLPRLPTKLPRTKCYLGLFPKWTHN